MNPRFLHRVPFPPCSRLISPPILYVCMFVCLPVCPLRAMSLYVHHLFGLHVCHCYGYPPTVHPQGAALGPPLPGVLHWATCVDREGGEKASWWQALLRSEAESCSSQAMLGAVAVEVPGEQDTIAQHTCIDTCIKCCNWQFLTAVLTCAAQQLTAETRQSLTACLPVSFACLVKQWTLWRQCLLNCSLSQTTNIQCKID